MGRGPISCLLLALRGGTCPPPQGVRMPMGCCACWIEGSHEPYGNRRGNPNVGHSECSCKTACLGVSVRLHPKLPVSKDLREGEEACGAARPVGVLPLPGWGGQADTHSEGLNKRWKRRGRVTLGEILLRAHPSSLCTPIIGMTMMPGHARLEPYWANYNYVSQCPNARH